MFKPIIIILCFLTLSCSFDSKTLNHHNQHLNNKKKYYLKVDDIQIVDDYKSHFQNPYIEHKISITPSYAIRGWIDKMLVAQGNKSILKITIKDASIKKIQLDRQSHQYTVSVQILITLFDDEFNKLKQDKISITTNQLIDTKLNNTTGTIFFQQLIKSLLKDFAEKIDASLIENFSDIII